MEGNTVFEIGGEVVQAHQFGAEEAIWEHLAAVEVGGEEAVHKNGRRSD